MGTRPWGIAVALGGVLGLHLIDRYALSHTSGPAPTMHPAARASLADLAAIAGHNTLHFLGQFRAATGSTPHQFVQRQRLIRPRNCCCERASR